MSVISELGGPSGLLGFGLDLVVRATILLAIALACLRAFGRRRPLIASAIGHATLLGLVFLPASTSIVPTFSIPLLRATAPVPVPPRAAVIAEETGPIAIDTIVPPPEAETIEGRLVGPGRPISSMGGPINANPTVPSTAPSPSDPGAFVVGTYAVVASFLLARLAFSLVGVGRLRRSSSAVDDLAWLEALDRLARRLGVARSVTLARSSRVGVPVVVGWLRPMILLPDLAAPSDPADHAEAILLHELAHIRRGDFAWNLVLRAVEAVYWPHPLAWLLGRSIVEARERACDAVCVHQMGGPSAYREALLAMAEGLARRPGPALGLTMARASKLGQRVAEIDRGRSEPRCLPRWPARSSIVGLALASTLLVGLARITRAETRPVPTPAIDPPAPAGITVAQEPKAAAVPVDRRPGPGRVFKLRVVSAETGKPVPKADVRVWMGLRGEDFRKADDEGRIELVYATGPDDLNFGVDVWGDGFAQQRVNWGQNPNVPIPDEATVKLQAGESLGGIVLDEQGRPIPGAAVYLWSHNYKRKDPAELLYDLRAVTGPDGRWHTGGAPQTTGELLGFYINHPDFLSDREYAEGREKPPIDQLRAGKAVSVMKKGVPITGRVLDGDGRPVAGALVISTTNPGLLFNGLDTFAVRTDPDGRFRTGQVKAGDWHLLVRAKGHAPAAHKLKVGTAVPSEEIRLQAPHTFRARVVDPDGRPIEGAFVNVDSWQGYRCLGVYLYTDADGRVRWDDAPEDALLLNVDRQGYLGLFQQRVEPTDREVVWTLAPSLSISGIVRDVETRKAVENAVIEYGAVDPASGEVSRWEKPPQIGWTQIFQGRLNAHFAVQADAYKIRISADGYRPFVSRAFRRDEKVVTDYDVTLVPGMPPGPLATAVRPDGRPLAGASVYRARLNENISLNDGQVSGRNLGRQAQTDSEGKFSIPDGTPPAIALILADDCFAYANAKALAASPRLQARPYGRVEGRLLGDRPQANRPIELTGSLQDGSTSYVRVAFTRKTTTDSEGRFAFDKVVSMPGLRISRNDSRKSPGWAWSLGEPVRVEDGGTTVVEVGGKGRSLVGRVDPPEGWGRPVDFTDRGSVAIESARPLDPFPLELVRGKVDLRDHAWSDWMHSWQMTPEGRAYADGRVAMSSGLAPDGSFRIDGIPPGEYRLAIQVNWEGFGRNRGPFGTLSRAITIPPAPATSGIPIDLGRLRLKSQPSLIVGDPAPPIEVSTTEGRKLAIPGDFAGKFLLLDIGAMWETQARLQIPRLNDVFARFGKDDRFAIVSLLMDPDRADSRAFVADKGQSWPQAIVGAPSNTISDAYGFDADLFDVPAAILIGPDGRIVARDLFYDKIGEAVGKALGVKEPIPKP